MPSFMTFEMVTAVHFMMIHSRTNAIKMEAHNLRSLYAENLGSGISLLYISTFEAFQTE
jgi:hypothetical protein